MLELTKEIARRHGIRFRRKEKQAFFEALRDGIAPMGLTALQSVDRLLLKNHNIVVGDIESADILFTAHYDTPPRMRVPANIIFPRSLALSFAYQLAWVLAILAASFAVAGAAGLGPFWTMELSLLLFIALSGFLLFGGKNKNNQNDNTSGVVALVELMALLPEHLYSRAAFVFFDNEELGLLGSAAFAAKYKKALAGKPVVNLDCVGVGDEIVFLPSRAALGDGALIERLNACLRSGDGKRMRIVSEKGWFYPSDHMNFKYGVGVGAFRRGKRFGPYINRIHTSADTELDKSNIEAVALSLAALVESTARARA